MLKKIAVITVIPIALMCCFYDAEAVDEKDISAKAAVVYQPDTGQVLFEKNCHEKLPMASTTKIMSALLLSENGQLDVPFTVDAQAIRTEGSSMGLTEGDIVTGRALMAGMLLPSGNDAANATAVYVSGSIPEFARLMNIRAAVIGMKDTHFVTPSGLHDDEHYSTAYDMALLTAEALEDPVFAEICGSSTVKTEFGAPPFARYLKNTNKLLNMYEGCIGVKTGFTDEAGRCLVSACERDGVRLICVTLNDRNDWNDHMALYDAAYSEICPVPVDMGNVYVDVAGGISDRVAAVQSESVVYPSVSGNNPRIDCKVIVPQFVYAPVMTGDIIGKMEFYAEGVKFTECDIVASEDIGYLEGDKDKKEELSLIDRITGFFKGLFT